MAEIFELRPELALRKDHSLRISRESQLSKLAAAKAHLNELYDHCCDLLVGEDKTTARRLIYQFLDIIDELEAVDMSSQPSQDFYSALSLHLNVFESALRLFILKPTIDELVPEVAQPFSSGDDLQANCQSINPFDRDARLTASQFPVKPCGELQ